MPISEPFGKLLRSASAGSGFRKITVRKSGDSLVAVGAFSTIIDGKKVSLGHINLGDVDHARRLYTALEHFLTEK